MPYSISYINEVLNTKIRKRIKNSNILEREHVNVQNIRIATRASKGPRLFTASQLKLSANSRQGKQANNNKRNKDNFQ